MSDRFDWAPEPELIDHGHPARARASLERLGNDTWGAALDWLYDVAMHRPSAGDTYPEARRRFFGPESRPGPAPARPTPWPAVLDAFRTRVAPFTYNAQHPGSFSYFTPPPLPASVAGEVLSQWMQQGVDVWHAGPIGAFVEEEVIGWLCDLIGLPPESAFGVLASGGVMANIMALAMARDVRLRDARGLDQAPRGRELDGVRVYVSDQAHFSIHRGLSVLGFPPETLRVIPSDERFRLRAAPVREAIEADRSSGLLPVAIAAVAGSTNTGSVDDVPGLAAVAGDEGLWLHVDAAYGGAVRLSARAAGRVPGLELADSVTVDPHKWFFQGYDIGGLLVRRRTDLLATFDQRPEYYASARPEDEPLDFYRYSIEGTRRLRALKLWMSWQHLGTEGLGRLVDTNLELAAELARRLAAAEDFEAVPPEPELSVVCFRHLPAGSATWPPERLDGYQRALQRALERDGRAWVSVTTLRRRTYLRAGLLNYLATSQALDELIEALRECSEGVLEALDVG